MSTIPSTRCWPANPALPQVAASPSVRSAMAHQFHDAFQLKRPPSVRPPHCWPQTQATPYLLARNPLGRVPASSLAPTPAAGSGAPWGRVSECDPSSSPPWRPAAAGTRARMETRVSVEPRDLLVGGNLGSPLRPAPTKPPAYLAMLRPLSRTIRRPVRPARTVVAVQRAGAPPRPYPGGWLEPARERDRSGQDGNPTNIGVPRDAGIGTVPMDAGSRNRHR